MIYPMSAEAAELARDQFAGFDPVIWHQEAMSNLETNVCRDPVKHLFPYLENDVEELAKLAIVASEAITADARAEARCQISEITAKAMKQYQADHVEAECERLAIEFEEAA